MKELVDIISTLLPIYPYEAAATEIAPYATYLLRESPIRTFSGIAGYEGTLTLSIYCATIAEATAMAEQFIGVLDRQTLDGRTYYYADMDSSDFPEAGLVSKDLTFNTL